MSTNSSNQLATAPTSWPIWYAILPFVGVIASTVLVSILALGGPESLLVQLNPLIQITVMTIIVILLVWALARKRPTAQDMGYAQRGFSRRNATIVLAVFVISHLIFRILSKVGGVTSDAKVEFVNNGFGINFQTDLILIIAGAVLAPLCEELIYRGVMLRALHDGLLRRFPQATSLLGVPALGAIIITALAFVMPHVADMKLGVITSASFSIVYLMTGSMVAAMVSHSLQSCIAFSTILLAGSGNYALSPIVIGIAITCPLIVYVIGTLLGKRFPHPTGKMIY